MLRLNKKERMRVWENVMQAIEVYTARVAEHRVTPQLDPDAIRVRLCRFDFQEALDPGRAIDFVVENLWNQQVHTPHPSYFGLFNPNPTTMGIAADTLVAAFNPQLAAWSHSPFAAEVEMHLVRAFASRFGYDPASCDGTFCSGGMEANHTALLAALTAQNPDFGEQGACSFSAPPVVYVSSEAHHSFLKAARVSGIGTRAVRVVPVDERLRMNTAVLQDGIEKDRREGYLPVMLVGTAGTTGAGVIDPLEELASIARDHNLWFHVDAAWGGAAALVPELRPLLDGCEQADSITFDAHKWLSVPMGAGIFLTRHREVLLRAFQVVNTYMPKDATGLPVIDPYAHSLQWSRRFIGLKVFLSLAVAGWPGYEEAIRHQSRMGEALRVALRARGWKIVNDTRLPVVCFTDPNCEEARHLEAIVAEVLRRGEAWISTALIGGKPAIRACITNYATTDHEIEALVATLEKARSAATKDSKDLKDLKDPKDK
ncbi:MAG: aminotransferase class V-fold PLP-dependent enzyme [Acidobacteria bacterium]|nr:MAG: aminotransferase class V-fold PLP-dependent enzyme [Acidobacteriota bacterium]